MATAIQIYLEVGRTRVFASAIDWPGWSRTAKTPEAAIEALADYADRYRRVVEPAGLDFAIDAATADFTVVETVPGTSTTDFGAPDRPTASDQTPVTGDAGARLAAIVAASWEYLGSVAASAPSSLRKGPRGGGRDRDAIVQHVVAAEAAYARKAGVRHPTPHAGDEAAVRDLRAGLLSAIADGLVDDARWSRPYAARRIAWHVLDHAWEIEDRSTDADG